MAKTANLTAETNEILKELEKKMSSVMSVVDSLSSKVDKEHELFVSENSAYFLNMASALGSSLHESEMDRRMYEEAMEQNRKAAEMSSSAAAGRSPERGDPGFWAQAFAPTPVSQAEMQATALKSTFSDSGVMASFKTMLAGINEKSDSAAETKQLQDIIKEATRGSADDRTFGEKALDKMGLGAINKLKNWWGDRDIRKEEKATAKDQGTIKREQKQMDRLSAKYRKLKSSGASEEELAELREKIRGHQATQENAARRISERRNTDLFETEMPTSQKAPDLQVQVMQNLVAALKSAGMQPAAPAEAVAPVPEKPVADTRAVAALPAPAPAVKTGEAITPDKAVSNALVPVVGKGRTGKLDSAEEVDAEVLDDVRTKDVTGDRNEPVELAKETKGALAPVGDTKEAADIQRRLDTTLRPDFYKEGTKAFKMLTSGQLLAGLSGALGGLGGAAKGALYAAAAGAVVASVAKVGQAVSLVKDWYSASSEAVDNVKQMTEQANAKLEERKNGVNDDMLAATQESNIADQKLHESEESWADSAGSFVKDTLFGGLFGKSDRKKAREAAADAELKRRTEIKKYNAMREYAKKAGVDPSDTKEMAKFKELYDKGESFNYTPPSNGKLAAGNLSESDRADTMKTPGSSAEPEKVETAQEQMRRQEEATYNATKRALLDNDVQKRNEENAKVQGRQIDQSLNGRK
jgi:hypothetical protein